MKKITLFGSPKWPGCEPVREYLLEKEITFDYVDITESMKNLKIFLAYRDKDPFFDPIKEQGSVGIPTVMIGEGEAFYLGYPGMSIKPFE